MKDFLKKFCLTVDETLLQPYFEKGLAEHQKRGAAIFDFEQYGAFSDMKQDIAALRDQLATDPDNALFCYVLAAALRDDAEQIYQALSAPKKEDENELYDILPLFALLDLIPDMLCDHRRRGLPEQISRDTVQMFENQVGDFVALHHRYGISNYVWWMQWFLRSRIIRINRFNIEIATFRAPYEFFEKEGELLALANGVRYHRSGRVLGSVGCEDEEGAFEGVLRETDDAFIGLPVVNALAKKTPVTLPKAEWRKVLTSGDTVISVHIPAGGPLTPEICERDLALAREVVAKHFGPFKAFYCGSWLLDPQLREIMGKDTNVTLFGDRFYRYPTKNDGKAVFSYLFHAPNTPVQELPEPSSMAKAVKAHLLAGGHIYSLGGVFL